MSEFMCIGCGRIASSDGRCSNCSATMVPREVSLPKGEEALPPEVEAAQKDPQNDLGKFILVKRLGRGGTGEVHKAWGKELKRFVAIKFILNPDDEDKRRLIREAQVAARLEHPNIVPVYEVGEAQRGPYIVMKFIDGDTLERANLTLKQKLTAIRDAALALEHAHLQGVIHRDIKPQNILVETAGRGTPTPGKLRAEEDPVRVWVMDFGIAKQVSAESSLTRRGAVVGTPQYMAPEQARGRPREVDERSDVYSLGATLYAILAGRPPFTGDDLMAILQRVISDEPIPLRQFNPAIPKDLETIAMKCLEKDKARRYQSARELAEDLQRYLDGEPIQARPVSWTYRLYRSMRRHPAAAIASACVVATALVLWYVLGVLPAKLQAEEDRQKLEAAVERKRSIETRFAELIAAGRYSEAIDLAEPVLMGATAAPANLHDPSRLSAYPELLQPWRLPLARAFLQRGAQAGGDASRGDYVAAYHAALESGDDESGREALLRLGATLEARGDWAGALATYRLCESRFAPTSESTERLAAALQRAGLLEEAAARWKRLGRENPLSMLLPRRKYALSKGHIEAADLDGDGKAELLHISLDAVLTVYRLSESGPTAAGEASLRSLFKSLPAAWVLRVMDVIGDARPEIFVAGGNGELKMGAVAALRWRDGMLATIGSDAITSACYALARADLDGDGTWEVVAGTGHYDRELIAYRVDETGLRRLGVSPMGCDVTFVGSGGDAARSLVVHLGPWLLDRGFRTIVLAPDEKGTYRKVAEGADRFHASQIVRLDDRTFVAAVNEDVTLRTANPELVKAGIYRFTVDGRNVSRLERIGGEIPANEFVLAVADVRTAKERVLMCALRNEFRLIRGGESIAFRHDRPRVALAMKAADVDGDGDSELLLHSEGVLEVWGSGAAATEEAAPAWTARDRGRGVAGQDLLDAKLFAEAEVALRRELRKSPEDARVHLALGTALMGQERYGEAAEAYATAARDRSLAVDAGLRRAHALERARDWAGLAQTLTWLESLPGLDSFAASRVAWMKSWAAPLANRALRSSVTRWDRGVALLCENPFDARVTQEGLEVWGNSDQPTSTGVALHYDGDPIRIRLTFSADAPEWGASTTLGMGLLEHMGKPIDVRREVPGPWLGLAYWAGGATDKLVRQLTWRAVSRDGSLAERQIGVNQNLPEAGREYVMEFDVIPGLDRVYVTVRERSGGELFKTIEMALPFQFERGVYVVGRWRSLHWAGVVGYFARAVIRSIEVEASSAATHVGRVDGGSAREVLLAANGALVVGAHEEAQRGYEEAVRRAEEEGDQGTLWRARLYRGLLLYRLGDEAGAKREVYAAVKVKGQDVRGSVKRAPPSLSDEERGFLLRVLDEDQY